MSQNQNPQFENIEQANTYIESVRDLYRREIGEYAGRRNEEQQLIAEVTSDEARLIVDGVLLGVMAVMGGRSAVVEIDDTTPVRAGYTWSDYRGEFERLLVGFAVMTNRLERDGHGVPGYADMQATDRLKAASVLFSDYQRHNALRFGVDTAGVHRTDMKTVHDLEEGTVKRVGVTYDKDKAKSDQEIDTNMKRRGFSTAPAAHAAGKISPEEYIALRREFPEKDKDSFDRDVSFYQNVRKEFENREN